MANEATVTAGLRVLKGTSPVLINYQSQPTSYQATVTGTKGPSPGAVNVSRNGTTVSFSELTSPSLCRLMNQDSTYFVEWGVWNPTQREFYPLGELLPGEVAVFRFSRNLREEYTTPGTGTGTGPLGSSEFRLKAEWASGTAGVNVLVEAFER